MPRTTPSLSPRSPITRCRPASAPPPRRSSPPAASAPISMPICSHSEPRPGRCPRRAADRLHADPARRGPPPFGRLAPLRGDPRDVARRAQPAAGGRAHDARSGRAARRHAPVVLDGERGVRPDGPMRRLVAPGSTPATAPHWRHRRRRPRRRRSRRAGDRAAAAPPRCRVRGRRRPARRSRRLLDRDLAAEDRACRGDADRGMPGLRRLSTRICSHSRQPRKPSRRRRGTGTSRSARR